MIHDAASEAPGPDPVRVFLDWYEEAEEAGILFHDAAALATATPDGVPSARMVLYKGMHDGAFVFYTNYESRKAREIDANPRAALLFYWPLLLRQVRVEGRVERAPAAVSDEYFATRPRESQVGAWASPQSEPIEGREALERRVAETAERFHGSRVRRPEFWGGYVVIPESIEFWISRDFRLHDRFLYTRAAEGWRVERLAP